MASLEAVPTAVVKFTVEMVNFTSTMGRCKEKKAIPARSPLADRFFDQVAQDVGDGDVGFLDAPGLVRGDHET